MLPEIQTLLILQERDHKLRRIRQDLLRLPQDEAAARARLAGDEAAVKAAKDAVAANEMAMKKLELDIETRRTTVGRLKTQQFETRKNDEYRALEHEIARYTEEVTKLEDQEIALMEKAEALKQTVAAAQEGLARTKKLVDEELAGLVVRKTNQEEAGKALLLERRDLVSQVEPALLQRYDRIFEKKAPAVVPMEHGVCGGCHMKLTAQTVATVKAEKALAACENCGRLLYFGE